MLSLLVLFFREVDMSAFLVRRIVIIDLIKPPPEKSRRPDERPTPVGLILDQLETLSAKHWMLTEGTGYFRSYWDARVVSGTLPYLDALSSGRQ